VTILQDRQVEDDEEHRPGCHGGLHGMSAPASIHPVAIPSSEELARERTVMAIERTQMAWIRTALSMLTLGFILLKFFQFLRQQDATAAGVVHGPRRVGFAIMLLGLVSLTLATGQCIAGRRRLGGGPLRRSPAFIVSVALLALQAGVLLSSLF
jgi:putative membrane protein